MSEVYELSGIKSLDIRIAYNPEDGFQSICKLLTPDDKLSESSVCGFPRKDNIPEDVIDGVGLIAFIAGMLLAMSAPKDDSEVVGEGVVEP